MCSIALVRFTFTFKTLIFALRTHTLEGPLLLELRSQFIFLLSSQLLVTCLKSSEDPSKSMKQTQTKHWQKPQKHLFVPQSIWLWHALMFAVLLSQID